MTESVSTWVIVLVAVNLGITVFLFLWGLRVEIPTLPDGTSGHTWAHGVLREGIRRLPTWWVVLSAGSLVAGIGYLALYPGLGTFAGTLGWTSGGELAQKQEANRKLEAPLLERIRGKPVETIAADPEALRVGQVLFIENCAACHGREARGNTRLGAPDLTLLLRIDPGEADRRGQQRLAAGEADGSDRFEGAGIEFQRAVASAYDELAARHPERIVVVDGAGAIGDVHARVMEVVTARPPTDVGSLDDQ